jgi:hypothetical protein
MTCGFFTLPAHPAHDPDSVEYLRFAEVEIASISTPAHHGCPARCTHIRGTLDVIALNFPCSSGDPIAI